LRTETTAQTQQINTLRATNTSLFQAMENLQQALDTARQLQEDQRPVQ
jgi:cell division protein FtsB